MSTTTHRTPRPGTPRRVPRAAAALAATLVLALSGCTGGGDEPAATVRGTADGQGTPGAGKKAAIVLDRPFEKPDLVLTDTRGERYDLIEETAGRPTLLYFGYTNCPDVCPLTMSNIAIARKALPEDERDDLRVVFVTSDPERDTPKRLGSWLRGQDPSFTGLTGDFDTIQAGARTVGVGIEPPEKEKDGTVVSTHGATVLAFSPEDDKAHVIYGEDTTAEQYAKDLPDIVAGRTP